MENRSNEKRYERLLLLFQNYKMFSFMCSLLILLILTAAMEGYHYAHSLFWHGCIYCRRVRSVYKQKIISNTVASRHPLDNYRVVLPVESSCLHELFLLFLPDCSSVQDGTRVR